MRISSSRSMFFFAWFLLSSLVATASSSLTCTSSQQNFSNIVNQSFSLTNCSSQLQIYFKTSSNTSFSLYNCAVLIAEWSGVTDQLHISMQLVVMYGLHGSIRAVDNVSNVIGTCDSCRIVFDGEGFALGGQEVESATVYAYNASFFYRNLTNFNADTISRILSITPAAKVVNVSLVVIDSNINAYYATIFLSGVDYIEIFTVEIWNTSLGTVSTPIVIGAANIVLDVSIVVSNSTLSGFYIVYFVNGTIMERTNVQLDLVKMQTTDIAVCVEQIESNSNMTVNITRSSGTAGSAIFQAMNISRMQNSVLAISKNCSFSSNQSFVIVDNVSSCTNIYWSVTNTSIILSGGTVSSTTIFGVVIQDVTFTGYNVFAWEQVNFTAGYRATFLGIAAVISVSYVEVLNDSSLDVQLRNSTLMIDGTTFDGSDNVALFSVIFTNTTSSPTSILSLQMLTSTFGIFSTYRASVFYVQSNNNVRLALRVAQSTGTLETSSQAASSLSIPAGTVLMQFVNTACPFLQSTISDTLVLLDGAACVFHNQWVDPASTVYPLTPNTLYGAPPSPWLTSVDNASFVIVNTSFSVGHSTLAEAALSCTNVSRTTWSMTATQFNGYGTVIDGIQTARPQNAVTLHGCQNRLNLQSLRPPSFGMVIRSHVVLLEEGETCSFTETESLTVTSNFTTTASITHNSFTQSFGPTLTSIVEGDAGSSGYSQTTIVAGAIAAAAVIPFAFIAPAGTANMQRSMLLAMLSACSGSSPSDPLPVSSSPTTMFISPDEDGYIRGAAVGNIALVVFLAFFCLLICVGVSRAWREPVWIAAADIGLPGYLYAPLLFLLQPTLSASLTLVLYPSRDGFDVALGVAIFGGLLLFTAWSGYKYLKLFRFVAVKETKNDKGLRNFLLGGFRWSDPRRCSKRPSLRLGHVESIFAMYRPSKHWFLCVDVAVACALGVCGAFFPATAADCTGLEIAVLCIFALYAGALLLSQPYQAGFDKWNALLATGLNLIGSVLLLFNTNDDDGVNDVVITLQIYLAIASQAVATIVSLAEFGEEVLAPFLRRKRLSRRGRASQQEQARNVEEEKADATRRLWRLRNVLSTVMWVRRTAKDDVRSVSTPVQQQLASIVLRACMRNGGDSGKPRIDAAK